MKFNNQLIGDISRIALVTLAFTAMAVLLGRPEIREYFLDIQHMRQMLQGGYGRHGFLLSAFMFVFMWGGLIAAGLPRLWASAAGGIVYGAFLGSLLSLLASILGASILYGAGSTILADIVERRVGGALKTWKERFQENAFWWVLYGRLFPFSNSTVMNLVCGSCRVSFRDFLLGSLLGFIPLTVVFATFGSGGIKRNLWQIALAATLLVLSVFSRKLIKKWYPATFKKAEA